MLKRGSCCAGAVRYLAEPQPDLLPRPKPIVSQYTRWESDLLPILWQSP